MSLIELMMKRLQPVQQEQVAGAGALSAAGSRRRRRVLLYRKLEKFALGRAAEGTRNPAVEKADDCLEHPVWRKGIAPMNPEDAPVETEHHRPVGVGDDSINVSQPKLVEPERELILEEEQLPRCPTAPLPGPLHRP
jgi:hypothetical protein